jgi:hypothetical protein
MKAIPSLRITDYLARFGVFLITVALIVGMTGCDGYTATSKDLEIWDWYDLDAVRDNLEGSHILMNDLDSTTQGYKYRASPTAHEYKGWEPIGDMDRFTGSFDGQGYEIRDLFINRPDQDGIGLFGRVGDTAVIKDVGVVNATVTGDNHVCGLVAENRGSIIDSYFTGIVTGDREVGGLVGENQGTVIDSYFTGSVTGNREVGGLVGLNEGTVSNSHYNYDETLINGENIIAIGALYNEDFKQWLANNQSLVVNARLSQENGYYIVNNVTDFEELIAFGQNYSLKFRLAKDLDLATEPNFYIPYFVGEFDGNGHKISNLSFNFNFVAHVGLFGYLASSGNVTDLAAENVTITACSEVGGMVGSSYGILSNSHSSGSVSGWVAVGGLVGFNLGDVIKAYSTGSVTGGSRVGGLVGFNKGTVNKSYSTCSVTGENDDVGGLVGFNLGMNYEGKVYNSYSTGSVSGSWKVGGLVGCNVGYVTQAYSTGSVTGSSGVGGLVGSHVEGAVSISFWDTETSGQATSDGGIGKTTMEMQNITTFSGAAWSIIAVALNDTNPDYLWNIVDDVTYPFLSWQS